MPKPVRRRGELSVEDVAVRLGRTPTTVRAYLGEKDKDKPRLKGRKRNSCWIVKESDLAAFMEEWPSFAEQLAEAKQAQGGAA